MSLDWTHTFSPTFFNELLVSAAHRVNEHLGRRHTALLHRLGLPNPNDQTGCPVVYDIGLGAAIGTELLPTAKRDDAVLQLLHLDEQRDEAPWEARVPVRLAPPLRPDEPTCPSSSARQAA